jgi:hypothetical protein
MGKDVEEVVAYFKVLYYHFSGGAEGNHEKHQAG